MLGRATDIDGPEAPKIRCGWEKNSRPAYACADGLTVQIASKRFGRSNGFGYSSQIVPINAVMYKAGARSKTQLFVSDTEFDRNMSQVVKGSKNKTITFPKTIRKACEYAFHSASLKSVVLNEGLEVLENAF